jgi:predicted phosphodiesterase
MARYGLLADIHGNLEALRAALVFLEARDVQAFFCLGDVVGYNADPDGCVAEVRDRGMAAVAGNHDLIAIGRLGLDRCARKAAYALRRTRRVLQPESAAWLATLPPRRTMEGGIVLLHGGVEDVELYLRTPAQIARNAALLAAADPGVRVCFHGHTHEPALWEVRDGVAAARPTGGTVHLPAEATCFVNPGAIDSARKGAPGRAECAVFDADARTVEFAQVSYDHEAAEGKARRQGYRQPAWRAGLRAAFKRR